MQEDTTVYFLKKVVLGEAGEPIVAERSENVKVIRLRTLTDSSDIQRLAGDILSHPVQVQADPRIQTGPCRGSSAPAAAGTGKGAP